VKTIVTATGGVEKMVVVKDKKNKNYARRRPPHRVTSITQGKTEGYKYL
jgi:hypothetical protein